MDNFFLLKELPQRFARWRRDIPNSWHSFLRTQKTRKWERWPMKDSNSCIGLAPATNFAVEKPICLSLSALRIIQFFPIVSGILTLFQKLWSSVPLAASVVVVWLDCSCMTIAVLHSGKMLHNWLRSFSFDSSCFKVKEVTIHLWSGRSWMETALNLEVEVSTGSKVTDLFF